MSGGEGKEFCRGQFRGRSAWNETRSTECSTIKWYLLQSTQLFSLIYLENCHHSTYGLEAKEATVMVYLQQNHEKFIGPNASQTNDIKEKQHDLKDGK